MLSVSGGAWRAAEWQSQEGVPPTAELICAGLSLTPARPSAPYLRPVSLPGWEGGAGWAPTPGCWAPTGAGAHRERGALCWMELSFLWTHLGEGEASLLSWCLDSWEGVCPVLPWRLPCRGKTETGLGTEDLSGDLSSGLSSACARPETLK